LYSFIISSQTDSISLNSLSVRTSSIGCYDISRPATDAWWPGSDHYSRVSKKSPSIGWTNPNRALAAQFGGSVGGFSDVYLLPLIHSCEMLVRSSDLPSSTTTACTDKLRARSFSSRLRFRRIDSKSSTMLLDLFTAFAPIIRVCNHPTVHSDTAAIVMYFFTAGLRSAEPWRRAEMPIAPNT
jgi:hypothetical protein